MRVPAYALLLTVLALPAAVAPAHAAGPAPTDKMPALLERARYVALGYDLGDGFVSADRIALVSASTMEDERRAIEAIRRDLEKWNRYIVTERPEQADILIMVRVGRRASLEVGGGGGSRGSSWGDSRGENGGSRTVSTRTVGAQLSSNDDRVDVYEAANGRPGVRLWSGAEVGGLAGAPPRLYKSFREEIEAATKAKKP
jgi:hypothetical protein